MMAAGPQAVPPGRCSVHSRPAHGAVSGAAGCGPGGGNEQVQPLHADNGLHNSLCLMQHFEDNTL